MPLRRLLLLTCSSTSQEPRLQQHQVSTFITPAIHHLATLRYLAKNAAVAAFFASLICNDPSDPFQHMLVVLRFSFSKDLKFVVRPFPLVTMKSPISTIFSKYSHSAARSSSRTAWSSANTLACTGTSNPSRIPQTRTTHPSSLRT